MPASSSLRQISGTSPILIQCICTSWRVVRSRKLLPKWGFGMGPLAKSAAMRPMTLACSGFRTPPGTFMHHERVPALLLRVDADPLEALDLARHLVHGREVLRVCVYYRLAHLERVPLKLIFSTLLRV